MYKNNFLPQQYQSSEIQAEGDSFRKICKYFPLYLFFIALLKHIARLCRKPYCAPRHAQTTHLSLFTYVVHFFSRQIHEDKNLTFIDMDFILRMRDDPYLDQKLTEAIL